MVSPYVQSVTINTDLCSDSLEINTIGAFWGLFICFNREIVIGASIVVEGRAVGR